MQYQITFTFPNGEKYKEAVDYLSALANYRKEIYIGDEDFKVEKAAITVVPDSEDDDEPWTPSEFQ